MVTLDEFHRLVGATIMVCQCIETDVKLMYAGMLEGDFDQNLEMVREKALGPVLYELELLDGESQKPYFSRRDYKLLYEIKNIRNYWVHKGYAVFVYLQGEKWAKALCEQYEDLRRMYTKLNTLAEEVQNVRLDIMCRFGRIKR